MRWRRNLYLQTISFSILYDWCRGFLSTIQRIGENVLKKKIDKTVKVLESNGVEEDKEEGDTIVKKILLEGRWRFLFHRDETRNIRH